MTSANRSGVFDARVKESLGVEGHYRGRFLKLLPYALARGDQTQKKIRTTLAVISSQKKKEEKIGYRTSSRLYVARSYVKPRTGRTSRWGGSAGGGKGGKGTRIKGFRQSERTDPAQETRRHFGHPTAGGVWGGLDHLGPRSITLRVPCSKTSSRERVDSETVALNTFWG